MCTVWHAPPLSLAGRLVLLNKLYCASLLSVKSLLEQVLPWRGAYSESTKIKIIAMYLLAGGQYRINVSILATAHLPRPNPKLTPTCYQLNVFFFLGGGGVGAPVARILILIHNFSQSISALNRYDVTEEIFYFVTGIVLRIVSQNTPKRSILK